MNELSGSLEKPVKSKHACMVRYDGCCHESVYLSLEAFHPVSCIEMDFDPWLWLCGLKMLDDPFLPCLLRP